MPDYRLTTAQREQHWDLTKRARTTSKGVVVAASPIAAEIGARTLARGGNAVDAAVATAAALHVCEPWSSGFGGGGFMAVYIAREKKFYGVNFSMKAAGDVDPANYPLAPGDERVGPFRWRKVVDHRHSFGPLSMLVPGAVDGLGKASERFGRLSWAETLDPVIALAEAGWSVGWYTTLAIGLEAAGLAAFPGTRDVFLRDGHYAPVSSGDDGSDTIRNPKDAATLRRLADRGYRDFYEGEIARDIIRDVNELGRAWTAADLSGYQARIGDTIQGDHAGFRLHAVEGLNGGPTLLKFFAHYLKGETLKPGRPGPDDYLRLATEMRSAWEERYATMGDTGPGDRCTTHFDVADAEGNMVSLTNTQGARFGSKVMLDRLGLLMNNGMFWFDPEPGHPNSIGPGKWPLTNACPMMVEKDGEAWLSLGASGGRRVPPMVLQLISFMVDHGLGIEEAFHVPRIDPVRLEAVSCDHRMSDEAIARIASRHPVKVRENAVYPMVFAVPTAIHRDRAAGTNTAMATIDLPYVTAITEDEVAAYA